MTQKAITNFLGSKAFLYVAGLGVVLLVLKNFDLLPERKTQADKKKDKEREAIALNPKIWTTTFWKDFPTKAFTSSQALNLAKAIYSSFGVINDDEAKIYGAFRSIKYRANVSQIADEYAKKYGRDLLSDLKSYFTLSEMNEVYDIILQKPE